MKVKTYMIAVYAVLVKNGKREIEELPDYCVKGFGNLHGAVAENGRVCCGTSLRFSS